MKEKNIAYYFIVVASVVIVLAGIKSASEIIVPFLLSLFLAIILLPAYKFFNKKGIYEGISLTLVVGVFILLVFLVAKLIGTSVQDFNSNIDLYTKQLKVYYHSVVYIAGNVGIEISVDELSTMLHSKEIMSFASNVMQNIGSMFTNSFVVLFSVVFMLLESSNFKSKIVFAAGDTDTVSNVENILSKMKEYMILKALMSLATGLIIWIALSLIGTQYAFLWAVIAFLFNFIPNIGSIIAAIPAVLLTLVQFGVLSSFIVASIYVITNIVIGTIVEPKVMGKGLGLSTLVVFLSLVFWGWLLGIVGMLLSIPLTIMIKIILHNNEKTKWISILLGTGEELKRGK